MEREVSMVVEIGVTLIAIAAFISILWFTVFMGKELSNDVSIEASGMLATTQSGRLRELSNTYTVLPTSGVYSILRANESAIGIVRCKICGSEGNGRCLLGHLDGKVSLEVNYLEHESWYELVVHNHNCDWYFNSCTAKVCPNS